MKVYISIFSIIVSIFFLMSCEDFLDRQPTDKITSEIFYSNLDEVNAALSGCYARLYLGWSGTNARNAIMNKPEASNMPVSSMFFSCLTDEAWAKGDYTGIQSIAKNGPLPTSGNILYSTIRNSYVYAYQSIAVYNSFLDRIVDAKNISEEDRNKFTSEVKFLRAYTYFMLANLYGGVIISLEPEDVNSNNLYRKQNTKEEVIDAVLNDLSEENINNLPDISYNGHVVRVAARALKMRVLLYEKKYEEVIEQYEKIKSSKVSLNLSPNYSELFNPNTQENNPEILFSVKHTYPNGVSSDLDMSLYTWGEIQVRREFTDSFEFLDGSKFSTSNPLYNPDHPFDNRDKRLKATAIDSTYGIFNRRPNGAAGLEKDHFICAKYVDTLKAPVNIVLISDQDYIILRYADVLLMYAEAKNELQGPSSDIYEVLGLIRERAGLPNLPPNLTKDQMRDKIKHERKVEFGMEGPLRYFDLKRWKDMPAVVTKIKDPGSTDFRKWDDKWYIWPFPQEAIDKNPSLIQNPF